MMDREYLHQTALEHAVLCRFHELYRADGFPSAEMFSVLERQMTPSGRYVELESEVSMQLGNRYFDLAGSYIEIKGISNGLMAAIQIKSEKLMTLEFATYGGENWDGTEDLWSVV